MTSTCPRLFDDVSRLFADAAGAARNVGREAESVLKTQVERLLSTMDVVTREEFEAVREMAVLARNDNDRLQKRLDELEARLAGQDMAKSAGAEPPKA